MDSSLQQALEKEEKLKESFKKYSSMAIAYSGGVDSTYLAAIAREVLGEHSVLLIADTPSLPRDELKEAIELAKQQGWNISIVYPNEFEDERYLKNDSYRCYYCKCILFQTMLEFTKQNNIEAIACGETADDLKDITRTGEIAIKEFGILTPLSEVGLHKEEIRQLSRLRQLPTADKPSLACLSTRIPTGIPITLESLKKIEAAEKVLKSLGFKQYRVRTHQDLARIELELNDLPRLVSEPIRSQVVQEFQNLGYRFITLDLAGYKTGSTATQNPPVLI
ncbi:MAG TPA: ATP-dependent sacrificial sulfur transferase LarE [Candidatus Hydrogenedens sp.]|nr:ATP-dependent sacrificial sulfur transferase LarE [Candidatus Hydrogenedens sp.]